MKEKYKFYHGRGRITREEEEEMESRWRRITGFYHAGDGMEGTEERKGRGARETDKEVMKKDIAAKEEEEKWIELWLKRKGEKDEEEGREGDERRVRKRNEKAGRKVRDGSQERKERWSMRKNT